MIFKRIATCEHVKSASLQFERVAFCCVNVSEDFSLFRVDFSRFYRLHLLKKLLGRDACKKTVCFMHMIVQAESVTAYISPFSGIGTFAVCPALLLLF